MMIQDEELRLLYQETNAVRLQNIQMGLLQLEQEPNNQTTIEDVRQEIHGLKGDSNCLGLDAIATVAQELEAVVKALQLQQLKFTLEVSDCLYQGIYIIEQLVSESLTGISSGLNQEQSLTALATTIASFMAAVQPENTTTQLSSIYVEDDELREIYRITSSRRLHILDTSLSKLENRAVDADTLEVLRRETHSLKGDSRVVGLDAVGDLIQLLENVVRDIQSQSLLFTTEVNDYLRDGLQTLSQLVHSATSGEPTGIDIDQALVKFTAATAALVSLPTTLGKETIDTSKTTVATAELIQGITEANQNVDSNEIYGAEPTSLIVDPELREIYQATSAERLERLESGLLYLEKHPNDGGTLSALLREAHSLKGDARSAGVEAVETLAHALEDIFSQIQRQILSLDSVVSDRLYEGLDAIGTCVQEAVTGEPINLDIDQLLQGLRDTLTSDVLPEDNAQPTSANPQAAVENQQELGTQFETVRVHTRDLDALISQTEELAITRIQIAQAASQSKQLMALWEDWQTHKEQQQGASIPSYEERLEQLILSLSLAVQNNSSRLESISETLRDRIRQLQLLPMSTLFQPLRRIVRDLARTQSKDINLVFEGENTTADKRLLDGIQDAMLHLVRNAVDHGIETPTEREAMGKPAAATLRIRTYQTAVSLTIEITDDGRGLDPEKIKQTAIKRKLHTKEDLEAMPISQIQRLILAPGFSTRSFITEISGRGVGLDVVRSQVEDLKGAIQIESTQGQGCTFRLQLSTALSTANVVLTETEGMTFAIPIEFLETTLLVSPEQIVNQEGQDTVTLGNQVIPIADLSNTLEVSNSPIYDWVAQPSTYDRNARPCIVLKVGNDQVGFLVDRLLNHQEVVVKPLGSLLKRVRNVSGTTILSTGDVCMILHPPDLLKSLQQLPISALSTKPKAVFRHKPIILLVEDSPPVRIQEKRLFEGAGYTVVTATDGMEGYNMLQMGGFDAVVSDVEMPHLDGFSLVTKIRQQQEYDDLPIILVTTLDSEADRQRGANAGANAYILKGRFNQEALLETLERLI